MLKFGNATSISSHNFSVKQHPSYVKAWITYISLALIQNELELASRGLDQLRKLDQGFRSAKYFELAAQLHILQVLNWLVLILIRFTGKSPTSQECVVSRNPNVPE